MSNHYKFWTVLSLIVVFAAGVLSGVLLDKYIFDKTPKKHWERADQKKRGSTRFPTLDMWAQELNLSPEQQEKISEIFKNNEERFKIMRKDMNERLKNIRIQLNNEIKNVLTEEQQAKYDAMIEKYLSQRKREMDKRKKQSDRQEKGEHK
ncbi:MAG: hypothetical protein PVF22_00975 [Candidatus Aminicenantes bacterium]|jgi:Spy/CpxP family protein refolding chaperone